jgi:hypothetical protein
MKCSAAPSFLEEEHVILEEFVLARLVEGEDSRIPMLELDGEDHFSLVDEEPGCFAGSLCRSYVYGSQHELEAA